jgi:hypothetical protein
MAILTENDWKPFGKKLADLNIKDGGLQQSLRTFERIPTDKTGERDRCLAILLKLTTNLHKLKEVNAVKDLDKHLSDMISAITKQQEDIFNARKDAKASLTRSPLLTENDFKPFAEKLAGLNIKDGGLQQSLHTYQNIATDKLPERERCLSILLKLTTALHQLKEVNADKDLDKHMSDMISAITKEQEQIFNAKKVL